jgi:hypothetical protein
MGMASRWISGIVALLLLIGTELDATAALAQSSQCAQLNAQLQSLDRNGDFRNSNRADSDIRTLQGTMQDAQSAYNRGGCMAAQQQGFPQTPECRSYAKQYLMSKAQLSRLQQGAANGDDVAQQREQVLQQIARFGCNQTNDNGGQQPHRRNFLEQLFGGGNNDNTDYGDNSNQTGTDQVEDPNAQQQQTGGTIRTVCVRKSDGYYWPVSYSTVPNYIPQDAQTCQAQCPNQSVDLYYYDNPGQEPEQMVNATGEAYTALPTAFAYRKQFDLTNTCKPADPLGKISIDGGRAMISFGGENFPLPIRDPRRPQAVAGAPATLAVAVIDVPLPRPRPNPAAAAAAAPVVPPTAEFVVSAKSRIVKVGDKLVRIVGPDTPYAPSTGG